MTLKRLLNLQEEATYHSLRQACERNEAHVYTKVRCADVLPIEQSGISDDHYAYALRAHFDFVVCDDQHHPLFAVEFDGPDHATPEQQSRDVKKDWLVNRFDFALLRINARYLGEKYRGMDLLTWFVEAWFALQWFNDAKTKGKLSHDEIFSPIFFECIAGLEKRWPLAIGAAARAKTFKLFVAGRIREYVPLFRTGQDKDGTVRGIAWLPLTDARALCAELTMRQQNFPIPLWEAISELLIHELGKAIEIALDDPELAPTRAVVRERIRAFNSIFVKPGVRMGDADSL